MLDFEKIIHAFSIYYFTPLIMLVSELLALILAIIYRRKNKIGKMFIFYIGFDFSILLITLFLETHPSISKHIAKEFSSYTNILISYVELITYYYFFDKILAKKEIKRILNILLIIFSCIILLFLVTKLSFLSTRYDYLSYLIGVLEFFFLLPPCVYYFYDLFKKNSDLLLLKRPTFWIVSGITFFSVVSIPYYLLNRYVIENYKSFFPALQASLFILPFTLNFIFLSKAFSCKKAITI